MTEPHLARLFATAFGAIFLAELGDKTQLATLALSGGASSGRARAIIFAASALALVATSAIGVLVGSSLSRYVPPEWIERAAGALFIVLGVLMLISKGSS